MRDGGRALRGVWGRWLCRVVLRDGEIVDEESCKIEISRRLCCIPICELLCESAIHESV